MGGKVDVKLRKGSCWWGEGGKDGI